MQTDSDSVSRRTLSRLTAGTKFLQRLSPASKAKEDDAFELKLGLFELTRDIKDCTAVIIFVHGLGGHPVKTWSFRRDPVNFWPQKWLPLEVGLEHVRVFTFGYGGGYLTKRGSTTTILDFAKKLLLEILTASIAKFPLIIVAHSMGGLLVKKAYMLALQDLKYQEISKSIRTGAMIFLGTPHRGSDSAVTLHRILSASIGSKAFVQELMRNSNTLVAINEDFRHHAENLTLWSFHETEPTSLGPGKSSIIVDRSSAILGYPNECSSHIDANHHTICKFETADSPGYITIKKLLVHLIEKIGANTEPRHGYSSSPSLPNLDPHSLSSTAATQVVRQISPPSRQLSRILGQEDTAQEDLLLCQDLRTDAKSCLWILDKEAYTWWMDTSTALNARHLLLHAPPGTGKSVLLGFIIEKLRTDGQTCAYYFFKVNSKTKRSTRAFMLSILSQMATHIPQVFDRLTELDEEHASIRSLPTRLLWQKVFIDILFKLECFEPWYWVIDGLDEAEQPNEIISLIGKIQARTCIKLISASRTNPDIERYFQKLNLGAALRIESINASDTKNDMTAFANQQLELLPLGLNEREEIVSLLVQKSQGIFLWVKLALAEMVATAHTKQNVMEVLEGLPSEMTNFYQKILNEMSSKLRLSNKPLAKLILQFATCAIRPLKIMELQAALQPQFGMLLDLKYTIHRVCPHLFKVDEATSVIQPIHGTVKDFLLQDRLSEFGVDAREAHRELTIVCLAAWRAHSLRDPKERFTTRTRDSQIPDGTRPLLRYSAQSWFEHLGESHVDKAVVSALLEFLQNSVLFWIEAVGILDRLEYLTQAGRVLEHIISAHSLNTADRDVIAGWAIDLARIVPKFGRKIVAHPFSIHNLIPALCPQQTCIYSRFGSSGHISVVSTGLKEWDDCLAHITGDQAGGSFKTMVCGNTHIIIGLSDMKGTVVVYLADTYQEFQRYCHGERITAMNIDTTGERIVTGGLRFVKLWTIKTGTITTQFENNPEARCLAVCLHPDRKQLISVAYDNTLSIWNIESGDRRRTRFTRPDGKGKHRGGPWGAGFDNECVRVSLAYKGWPLEVWDIEKGEIIKTLPMRNPIGACFNPVSGNVYGVDVDATIMVSTPYGETEIDAQSHILACSPSGTLLATGHGCGCLKIYGTDTLDLLCEMDNDDDPITALAFSPDGRRLYDVRSSGCNVWDPEILLMNRRARCNEASSDESEAIRLPTTSTLLDSPENLHYITALTQDKTGEYICCGKSNGIVSIYETKTGKQLQEVYKHAPTVSIVSVVWSADGRTIATGDNSGRVIAVNMERVSRQSWKCDVRLDLRLDRRQDGGMRQVLLSPENDRLLVSSQMASSLFKVEDGTVIEKQLNKEQGETSRWIAHPKDASKLISISSQSIRIFTWDGFEEVTAESGIRLEFESSKHAKHWNPGDPPMQIEAYVTQDGNHIVSAPSHPGDRWAPIKCSFWRVDDIKEQNKAIKEAHNLNDIPIHAFVGTYRNRAVFLDGDLWVCTKAVDVDHEERPTRHFYIPCTWTNMNNERLTMITHLGALICTKYSDLIIVFEGMRCTQDPYLDCPPPTYLYD